MEVSSLTLQSIKVKTKQGSFGINPYDAKSKISVDGLLFFDKSQIMSVIPLETPAVTVAGPGDYEIKGVKIEAIGKTEVIAYSAKIEGMDVCMSQASLLASTKETLSEYQVLTLDVNEIIEQGIIAKLGVQTLILYGDKAIELAKLFGKEVVPVSKFSITKDKLPAELEIIVIG